MLQIKQFLLSGVFAGLAFLVLPNASANTLTQHRGFYVQGGMGEVKFNEDFMLFDDTSEEHGSGFGAEASGGYQFNRFFSLELGTTYMASTSVSEKQWLGTIAGKVLLPLGQHAAFYPKFGFGENLDENEGTGLLGLGFSYALTSRYDLNLEATYFNNVESKDATLFSAGLAYHF